MKTFLFSSDVRLHLWLHRRGVPYKNIKCCMFAHGPPITTWNTKQASGESLIVCQADLGSAKTNSPKVCAVPAIIQKCEFQSHQIKRRFLTAGDLLPRTALCKEHAVAGEMTTKRDSIERTPTEWAPPQGMVKVQPLHIVSIECQT